MVWTSSVNSHIVTSPKNRVNGLVGFFNYLDCCRGLYLIIGIASTFWNQVFLRRFPKTSYWGFVHWLSFRKSITKGSFALITTFKGSFIEESFTWKNSTARLVTPFDSFLAARGVHGIWMLPKTPPRSTKYTNIKIHQNTFFFVLRMSNYNFWGIFVLLNRLESHVNSQYLERNIFNWLVGYDAKFEGKDVWSTCHVKPGATWPNDEMFEGSSFCGQNHSTILD